MKCGYAGSDYPAHIIPSMVGRSILRDINKESKYVVEDLMVGDEASKLRAMLEISYPMENGIVQNWEDMCHVWDYMFGPKKMNIDEKNSKILLTESAMNPLTNREKLFEVRKEVFHY